MRTQLYFSTNSRLSGKGTLLLILIILTLLAVVSSAQAQLNWTVQNSTVLEQTFTRASGPHPVHGWESKSIGDTIRNFSPVPGTHTDSAFSFSTSGVYVLTHPSRSDAFAWIKVEGEGTNRVRVRWYANAETFSVEPARAQLQSLAKYALRLNLGTSGSGTDSLDIHYAWSQRMFAQSLKQGTSAYIGHHSLRLDVLGYDSVNGLPTRNYSALYDHAWDFPAYVYSNSDSLRENRTGSLRVHGNDSVVLNLGGFLFSNDGDGQALAYGEILLSLNGPVDITDFNVWTITPPGEDTSSSGNGNVSSVETARNAGSAVAVNIAPNPFSTETQIQYSGPAGGSVSLIIANERGEVVHRVDRLSAPSGNGAFRWDGQDGAGKALPFGVYVYRIIYTDRSGAQHVSSGVVVRDEG